MIDTEGVRKDTCQSCRWVEYQIDPQNLGSGLHTCHWNPPHGGIMAGPQGIAPWAAFPVVKPDQWCGHYSRRIETETSEDGASHVQQSVSLPGAAPDS
jgi:hypothetical protein